MFDKEITYLTRKFHRLQALQRRGTLVRKAKVDELEYHECSNCKTEYHGNYCPACGQRGDTKRLTFAEGVDTLLGIFYNFDRGFLHTLIDLFYRPGYMIRDYIRGRRSEYVKPIQLLFWMVTILVGLQMFTKAESGNAVLSFVHELKQYLPQTEWVELAYKTVEWMCSEMAVYTLVKAMCVGFPMWFVFRRTDIGSKTNVAESFYIRVYMACVMLMFSILSLPFQFIQNVIADSYSYTLNLDSLFSLFLETWILHQFYQTGWKKTLRKVILYDIIYVFFIVLVIVILVLIAVFLGIGSYIDLNTIHELKL